MAVPELAAEVRTMLREHRYELDGFIGRGSTCCVYKLKSGKTLLAAKVMDKARLEPMVRDLVAMELRLMPRLEHPGIVRTERVIDSTDYSVLITEFADQGDLISMVETEPEPNIPLYKRWFLQITRALSYLHAKGIAHRDLKADNVLLCSGVAKIADFGYATYCVDANGHPVPSTLFCGTLEYKAPEALLRTAPYNPRIADCFSLGVLLYVMMTHQFPFAGTGDQIRSDPLALRAFHRGICEKRWTYEGAIANDEQLQSLLSQLLNPNIRERITAAQCLAHPWTASISI